MTISASMARLMADTASTKRAITVAGKRSAAVIFIEYLKCLPLDPLGGQETIQELDTPIELHQTVVDGDLDIVEGDIFVHHGVDYAVRQVEYWSKETGNFGEPYKLLILERINP